MPQPPLWKQRNFLLLWSGQLASWLGTEISGIAMPLIVLALTGSPAQAGAVAAIRGLVYVVWAIPAGVVIDRWDRRLVMAVANLGSGLAVTSIAVALALHRLTIPQLLLASAVEGSCFVFANLGRFAALTRVVSREQFPAAAAQTGTAENIALLTGPPLGGFLYQTVGGAIAILLDALSYFYNAISIFLISVPLRAETNGERKAVLHEVAEGIRWLWNQHTLRLLNVLTALRIFITTGLTLMIIIVAREQQGAAVEIGAIFATGAVGGIVGSLLAPAIHRRLTFWQLLLVISILSTIVMALYSFATNLVLLAAITALYYLVDPIYFVGTSSYSAKTIPDSLRGRISSLTRLVVLGAHSFGFFITGILLEKMGKNAVVGLGCLLFAIIASLVATQRPLFEREYEPV